jgi:hypothetical protein
VEAKSFVFTVVEGASVVRLEERRRNFSGLVLLGAQSVGWLVSTMESLLWYPGEKDFVRSFREGSKVLIVRRGGNAAGRFLEVAIYAVGGRRGIIYILEGYEGRGWRKVVLELSKVRDFLKIPDGHGMFRLASIPERPRRAGDDDNEGSVPLVPVVSPGKNGVSSFTDVLCRGAKCQEVEKKLSHPVVPVEEKRRDLSVKEKKLYRTEKPLVKDLCDSCGAENVKEGMGVSRLPENSTARGKDGIFFGDYSADFQLTGVEHTFPSLSLWKSQLEKLKADVDQALSRVCEGLFSFGPGSKSRRVGMKNKNKKKKSRLSWVSKVPKPISFDMLADSVVFLEVGPLPALGYGGSEKLPAVSELSGGSCPMSLSFGLSVPEHQSFRPVRGPRPDYGAATLEDGLGSSELLGTSPVIPKISDGSASSTGIPELASLASQPEPNSGIVPSVLGLETNLTLVDSLLHVEVELVVGAGSDPSDTLVASDFSPSVSSLVSGPFSHKPSTGLRFRNGLDFVSISEEEGVFSVGIPSKQESSMELSSFVAQSVFRSDIVEGGVGDEVEGLGPLSILPLAVEMDKDSSSNVSPRWVLERVKGYYKLVRVSCDQFEDKLLALFTVLGVKGQREIKRLDCSINYDKKGKQSYRRRGKGRGLFCVNEA